MATSFSRLLLIAIVGVCLPVFAAVTPQQIAQLPAPASHTINFTQEVKPILEERCVNCHGHGRDKGNFQIDTRDSLMKGGDTGAAVLPGDSAHSYLIELVQGFDPDEVMPKKGTKLTPEQIGLLRAWIDQGMKWDDGVTFGRAEPANLKPHRPQLPGSAKNLNPIDAFLQPYFKEHGIKPPASVDDRIFARRAYLDITGLLPSPKMVEAFESDHHTNKRQQLVRTLLADNSNYAQNWMTFWNDALRNDYRGTGYIDGGREQITAWLYSALATNMPYNTFVAELINPTPASEGFTKGIVWRGTVNASQTPQMQAAQNISQVFMGVNLKCASCHDSFINDLTLADAYGLAGVYADGALEMVHCDKPTGKKADLKFLYPELGTLDPKADKPTRLKQLAAILTERQDARLTRTFVNRLWQKFIGRGLIEPVDDMEKPAWNTNILDVLSEDFADHNFDVKFLIEEILTSKAYQLPAVAANEADTQNYVFRGPLVRRMSAEEFRDALAELTGVWYETPAGQVDYNVGTKHEPIVPPVAAQWIWSNAEARSAAPPGTNYYRKTFKLESLPTQGFAFAAADNSFTLYVNGKKIGSGKDFVLKSFDIAKSLVRGENCLAVTAVNGGDAPNPAGLFVYAYLREHNGKASFTNDLATDASWLWNTNSPKGWSTAKFATTGWKKSFELGPPSMNTWGIGPQFQAMLATPEHFNQVRSVLANADQLQVALGRPNREQVVTTRFSAATTLQALELTNGKELSEILQRGAENILKNHNSNDVVNVVYLNALGRKPTRDETKIANEIVGKPVQFSGVEDLLWSLAMLPEFQLIY